MPERRKALSEIIGGSIMNQVDTAKIANLNDTARRNIERCVVSRGVAERYLQMNEIFVAVRDYADFNEDNDPYGEHDFGSFELGDTKYFWKIDYYTEDLSAGCDPLDPRCRRILTILLAEEY
jgi:hypothetical protein